MPPDEPHWYALADGRSIREPAPKEKTSLSADHIVNVLAQNNVLVVF
jgi:hypothetical protein